MLDMCHSGPWRRGMCGKGCVCVRVPEGRPAGYATRVPQKGGAGEFKRYVTAARDSGLRLTEASR